MIQKLNLLRMSSISLTLPICQHYKFGHCKFGNLCRFEHVSDVCKERACEVRNCTFRHPKKCTYFHSLKYCKFADQCSFSHENVVNELNAVEMKQNQLDKINQEQENEILEMKTRIDVLEKENVEIKLQLADLLGNF